MKPNSTWYANSQRVRILMMSVISGHVYIVMIFSNEDKAKVIQNKSIIVQYVSTAIAINASGTLLLKLRRAAFSVAVN